MDFAALLGRTDRSVVDHLGGPVTYVPSAGDPVEVSGIFDAAYQRVDVGEAGVVSSSPAVFLMLEDLPSDPEEDPDPRVVVSGFSYKVTEPQKDGAGGVLLLLQRWG